MGRANDNPVTVTLTRVQLAALRSIVFRELARDSRVLMDQAQEATETGGGVIGEDALGTFRQMVCEDTELLNVLGWSVDGDHALLMAEAERRREPKAA
jgi:hypothetical protein